MDSPASEPITTARVLLEPLSVGHAPSMVNVLAEPSLCEYTGGEASSLEVLEHRYSTQTVGQSADGSRLVADIAWVVSPVWRGNGIASEATRAMFDWLRSKGVQSLTAHIHPDHEASMRVAQNQGLHATSSKKDGETRWKSS